MRKRRFELEQQFKHYDKLTIQHAIMDLGESWLDLNFYSIDHREPITITVTIEGWVRE